MVSLSLSLVDELLEGAFNAIDFEGNFGITGRVEFDKYKLPRINVEGVGRLSWPITTNNHQIELLKNIMEKTPFGKGIDEKERTALHIDGSKLEIDNSFDYLVKIVTNQLGINEYDVRVRLNKLVLYEGEEALNWHQDTKKEKNSIGSLLIHLPSYHEGGELSIKHEGILMTPKNNQQEREDGFFYSAFYSDCFLKINSISKGQRFFLIYDLIPTFFCKTICISNANALARFKLNIFVDILRDKSRIIIPLDHKYSNTNRCILKGQDRKKLSLLQNIRDENGNNLFFIALGHGKRKKLKNDYYKDIDDSCKITTCLPHSLFNDPASFKLKFTDAEAKQLFSKTRFSDFGNRVSFGVQNFAVIWLSKDHFSTVCPYYDITDDICCLAKTHPDYAMKYLDELIKKGTKIEITVATTFTLRDKKRFLSAIAGEPPKDSERFYKIISDSIKSELVSLNEVIPQIARFMGRFDKNQAKFFSNIEDIDLKEFFFNEIKKSANFKSTGLRLWLDAHKKMNYSFDYIFEKFYTLDKDCKIEVFSYCCDHYDKLKEKALEYGKYFCSQFSYLKNEEETMVHIVLIFIKLNDAECLKSLIDFLLYKYSKDKVWKRIAAQKEQTFQLIPFIFDNFEKSLIPPFRGISFEILKTIFHLMIYSNDEKNITPRQYSIPLCKRLLEKNKNIDNTEFLILANHCMQIGDESLDKELAKRSFYNKTNWINTLESCRLTKSFLIALCDLFTLIRDTNYSKKWDPIFKLLIRGNIDADILGAILSHLPEENAVVFAATIMVRGREDEIIEICSSLSKIVVEKWKCEDVSVSNFLLSVLRNDDIGAKFLHDIDVGIKNHAELNKKFLLVDNILFNSDLNLQSNVNNYSSGFLIRIKNLISFELDYLKNNYSPSLITKTGTFQQPQTVSEGIIEHETILNPNVDFQKVQVLTSMLTSVSNNI